MFRQTSSDLSGMTHPDQASMEGGTYVPPNTTTGSPIPPCDCALQWRAEHMFRQTSSDLSGMTHPDQASMEGGTYVPPNSTTGSELWSLCCGFNGGRNICSAKRRIV